VFVESGPAAAGGPVNPLLIQSGGRYVAEIGRILGL